MLRIEPAATPYAELNSSYADSEQLRTLDGLSGHDALPDDVHARHRKGLLEEGRAALGREHP